MRVVIVGAGKLGFSVAELLSKEDYDVVLIDMDEEQLQEPRKSLDVLTKLANGATPSVMNDPDVRGADLLLAATGSDEVNMVACVLAKKHGIARTIARVRDMDLIGEAKADLKESFSIDRLLNPELVTAREIHRLLMTPNALSVEEFAQGTVRLFETKVQADSKLVGPMLRDLGVPRGVLVGLVFRGRRMIIPHGETRLQAGDNVYFIGLPQEIEAFSESALKKQTKKLERAMIVGAGRTGRALALLLEKQGIDVKVIDIDKERCQRASEVLEKSIVLCGDGTDIGLLTEEGISEVDALICLTEDDKLNLMIALLAKHLGAEKTVVRVVRAEYAELMEKVGVDVALSVRLLAASEVLAFARQVVSVSLLEGAQAEAMEVIMEEGASAAGMSLQRANLPRECLVCAYVRAGAASIPRGDSVLLPGDRIILFVQTDHAQRVMRHFSVRDE